MPGPKKPKKQQKTGMITLRVSPADRKAIKAAADRDGRSVSAWLLRAAMAAIEKESPK